MNPSVALALRGLLSVYRGPLPDLTKPSGCAQLARIAWDIAEAAEAEGESRSKPAAATPRDDLCTPLTVPDNPDRECGHVVVLDADKCELCDCDWAIAQGGDDAAELLDEREAVVRRLRRASGGSPT